MQLETERKSWKEYAQLAQHYKALGNTEIYLSGATERPWELATQVENGGMVRLNIPVSYVFRAHDAKSGMTFRWFFDIESKGANGSGQFHINLAEIKRIRELLPPSVKKEFVRLLSESAAAVRKQGDEYAQVASDQYGMAYQLEQL